MTNVFSSYFGSVTYVIIGERKALKQEAYQAYATYFSHCHYPLASLSKILFGSGWRLMIYIVKNVLLNVIDSENSYGITIGYCVENSILF